MTVDITFHLNELAQFTGTEHWHRHPLASGMLFTDGVKYVADRVGAYWLLDEIVLAQRFEKAVAAEEFQLWELRVAENLSATLTCDDGSGHIVYSKEIPFTDFPACGVKLYMCNSVIHLPSEY